MKTTSALLSSATLASALLVPTAFAQQFQHQIGLIPGLPRWTEGVESADVDQDGDLDLFFADGEGFMSAGAKRQNVLVINKLIEMGSLSFADESVARLGAHVSNAKGVTTADVNADGWVDALFSNAFFTDTPFLYINQGFAGAGSAGFFNLESASRGLTTALSSGGGMFGDLDDDGDLDLVINGAYAGSGKPRLYVNDGTGVFTENAAALNAPTKSTHMDVQLADVDNDFDVDFFGPNRASNAGGNHYLMLNGGAGTFTDSSSILGATSANVYEADVGDLDNDTDLDLFFVSLSGFAEGAQRNNLVPSAALTFTNQSNLGGDDDNEIAFCDYDLDGDLDPFVGSLGVREKLWRNDGGFAFTSQSIQITAVSDSTLDCTIADLDNDGRYDLITAQGESNPAQWANKVYRNVSGPVDTLPPVVWAIQSPATAPSTGPVVVKTKVRDQVMDDGVDHLTASARYVILTSPATQAISIGAGAFTPANVSIPAGTTVTWTNSSGASRDVVSTTAPYTYASGTIANGGAYAHAFVAPGTYNYASTLGGFSGTVTVTGTASAAQGLRAGIGLYRFQMNDTAGGAGIELVYECEFEDWPGNRTVTNDGKVTLGPTCAPPTVYCTPKVSSNFCTPSIASSGTPSVGAPAGFSITTASLEDNKNGLTFFSTTGANSAPFQGGFLCAKSPLYRLAVKNTGGAGICQGSVAYTLADVLAHPSGGPLVVPGQHVNAQTWARDPGSPSTTSLSDGLQFQACP